MQTALTRLFPLWAIAFSALAYFFPHLFTDWKVAIIPLLSVIMFCMGLTLHWRDFYAVFKSPAVIALGVAIQYLCMPFFAWLIAWLLKLSPELMAGMVLVGASAGGTASNVICYLAKGNVALSILMTVVSTLCAVLLMPFFSWFYLNQTIDVPTIKMLTSILKMVLIPVTAGVLLNSLIGRWIKPIKQAIPLISSLAIIVIIAIIIALNHQNLSQMALPVLTAVILHNVLGLICGYSLTRLCKFDKKTARTISIEVGMQNSGLSVALAIQYFTPLTALPGALFSIWHNLSGSLLAMIWQKKK